MIKWSDIQAEYADLETGFRERVVRLFQKYEGQETDEKVRGKVVTVTVTSFSAHMGIPRKTFDDWVRQANTARRDLVPEDTCINDGVPPKEGIYRRINKELEGSIPLLQHLSADTHELILEDIEEMRLILDRIEANLKVSK